MPIDPQSAEGPGVRPRSPRSGPSDPPPGAGRGWLRMAMLVLLAIAVLLAIRPAHRAISRWRALTIVSQAEELIRQQLFAEAIEKLDTALKLDDRCPEALRALGEVYGRFELPAALPVWRALASSPSHTENDVQQYLEVALRLQRFDLAEVELARLLSRSNITTRTRILATEFFYRMGDLQRALAFANEVRRIEPTNNTHQLRVARILLNVPNLERQRDGANLLLSLRDLTPGNRIDLLEILNSAPGIPRAEVLGILDKIPEAKEPTTAEYFLRADLKLRLEPSARDRIAAAAVTRYRTASPELQTDLCTWLNRTGEHDRLLRSYNADEAAKSPGVLTNYLEALARADRWADLQKTVAAELPIDPWLLQTLRASAALRLGQTPLADEHWRRAFDAAAGQPQRLRALGDLAARLGATDAAIRAFQQLAESRLYRGTAFRRLAQIHERQRNAEALRTVMQAWSVGSDNPFPEQAFCYLSALLIKDVDTAYERAKKLFETMPSRLPYRATLAFLELRRGNAHGALALFERASIDPALATPQTRLIEAAVLEASGQLPRAREIARTLKLDPLLPQEQELVRRIAGK